MNVLLSLLLSNPGDGGQPVIPKWLPAQLLVIESLLVLGDSPRSVPSPKEDDDVVRQPIAQGSHYAEARNTLFEFCMRLLAMPTLPKDELISALRIFILPTRESSYTESFVKRNGVTILFHYMRVSSGTQSGVGIQSYIAIVLQHIFENPSTLQHVMRQQLRHFFSYPRTHIVDVGTFVSGCNTPALRGPQASVEVTEELCQISHPHTAMKTISLKAEKPTPLLSRRARRARRTTCKWTNPLLSTLSTHLRKPQRLSSIIWLGSSCGRSRTTSARERIRRRQQGFGDLRRGGRTPRCWPH